MPKNKRPFGDSGVEEDNIKLDLREICHEDNE